MIPLNGKCPLKHPRVVGGEPGILSGLQATAEEGRGEGKAGNSSSFYTPASPHPLPQPFYGLLSHNGLTEGYDHKEWPMVASAFLLPLSFSLPPHPPPPPGAPYFPLSLGPHHHCMELE